jgi:hypothetical protein
LNHKHKDSSIDVGYASLVVYLLVEHQAKEGSRYLLENKGEDE